GRSRTAGPGHPGLDLLRLAGPPRVAEPTAARRGRPARADPQDPRGARARRHLRLTAGVAGAAPPRRARRAQARRAPHARPRAARRPPTTRLEDRLDPAEPEPYRRAGPRRPGLPGRRAEPPVGGRPDASGHR